MTKLTKKPANLPLSLAFKTSRKCPIIWHLASHNSSYTSFFIFKTWNAARNYFQKNIELMELTDCNRWKYWDENFYIVFQLIWNMFKWFQNIQITMLSDLFLKYKSNREESQGCHWPHMWNFCCEIWSRRATDRCLWGGQTNPCVNTKQ